MSVAVEKPEGYRLPPLSQLEKIILGLFALLLIAAFYPMWKYLPSVWFNKDGYYSHGALVPFLSGYIIWMRREQLMATKIKQSFIGLPMLVIGLIGAAYGKRIDSQTIFQASFFIFLFGTSLFLFGKAITKLLALPILFLGFMLPLPDFLFDSYTNPVQALSTKMANFYLQMCRFNTMMDQNNIISLDHYSLNVGIPCSGFKLSISLLTFTVFFIAISKLEWWKNIVLLACLLPIAIVVNGLRIALIGIVGELTWVSQGEEAAMHWGGLTHDYSGYVLLFLAFGILFWIARRLGWKM